MDYCLFLTSVRDQKSRKRVAKVGMTEDAGDIFCRDKDYEMTSAFYVYAFSTLSRKQCAEKACRTCTLSDTNAEPGQ
jgi:hypothetical protein